MPGWNCIQKELRGAVYRVSFHAAAPLSFAPIHYYPSVRLAHPVRRLRAMFLLQGTQ